MIQRDQIVCGTVYAEPYGRVCLDKDTGKLIEFQSGIAPLGTLTANALRLGYNKDKIEEKYVTMEEWLKLREKWIVKPALEAKAAKQKELVEKKKALKEKLGLSNEELKTLIEIINNG